MLEIARFEARRRARGTLLLSGVLIAYIALVVGLFPSIRDSDVDFEAYLESIPPELQRAIGGEVATLTRIDGYLAIELYQWLWLLVLGTYFAYAAASLIAGEVESGSIDGLLVNPVSRSRVVVGKYVSIATSVATVNAVTLVGTVVGVGFIGEEVDLANLVALHALAVVYLLACAGVGLVGSVVFDTVRRAQVVGIGTVFGMFLVDSLTLDTDYEWVGSPAFSRYFDPSEILVEGQIDWGGIAILVAITAALVVASAEYFERKDIA